MLINEKIGSDIRYFRGTEPDYHISFCPRDILLQWDRAHAIARDIASMHNSVDRYTFDHVISIINELIENSVKFTDDGTSLITINSRRRDELLQVEVLNKTSPGQWKYFRETCNELFSKDPKELFLQKIKNLNGKSTQSGIGLVLLKKDRSIKLNVTFFRDENENNYVSVTVQVDLNN